MLNHRHKSETMMKKSPLGFREVALLPSRLDVGFRQATLLLDDITTRDVVVFAQGGDGPAMSVGAATPLPGGGRDDWISTLINQIEDLRSRLDQSEGERRGDVEAHRKERDRLLVLIENLIKR